MAHVYISDELFEKIKTEAERLNRPVSRQLEVAWDQYIGGMDTAKPARPETIQPVESNNE